MCNLKFSIYSMLEIGSRNLTKHDYSCEETKELAETWKSDFRLRNRTDDLLKHGLKDRYYDSFCEQIDTFLKLVEDEHKKIAEKLEKYLKNKKNHEKKCKKMNEEKGYKSKDYEKCEKCPPEDHEGFACRCEMRNIRVAKEHRNNQESWNHKNDN